MEKLRNKVEVFVSIQMGYFNSRIENFLDLGTQLHLHFTETHASKPSIFAAFERAKDKTALFH